MRWQLTAPSWFRQIARQSPSGYTVATIDCAAQRNKEWIPIDEINLCVRKSGMNGAACITWPAAHVQHPQAPADREWKG